MWPVGPVATLEYYNISASPYGEAHLIVSPCGCETRNLARSKYLKEVPRFKTIIAPGPQLPALCSSLTHSGSLSHTVYSFCSVHPWLASSICMSKFQSIRDRMERSSKYARLDRATLRRPSMPFISSEGLERDSPLPDTTSRAQSKRLQCGLVIAAVFGRRIRKPALWGECVREGKIGAAMVCGPLMNAYGDLETLISWSEIIVGDFYTRFRGQSSRQLARLRDPLSVAMWLE